MKFCCDDFRREAGRLQSPVAGGMYLERPNAQFELDENGTWNINGCCGGGCYVVTNMRFCPYCGAKLADVNPSDRNGR